MENELASSAPAELRGAALIAASHLIASSNIASQQLAKPDEVVKFAVQLVLKMKGQLWLYPRLDVKGIDLDKKPPRRK